MSNKENNHLFTTDCLSGLPLVWIACPQDNHGIGVIMAPITEEQEKELDEDQCIIVKDQFDRSFLVEPRNCYVYGKLNLHPKSDDINKIAKNNLFGNLYINIFVYSEYDYNTHTVTSDVQGGRWYETDNVENYLPYLHGVLGKPERVVIFRKDFDILSSKKTKNNNRAANRKHYIASRDYYKSHSKRKTELKRKAKVSKLQFKIKK